MSNVSWPAEPPGLLHHGGRLRIAARRSPTGERLSPDRLLAWNEQLEGRGGWLVVDEAFIDATPGQSIVGHCPRPGLIGLRSLGRFFGLAGARTRH